MWEKKLRSANRTSCKLRTAKLTSDHYWWLCLWTNKRASEVTTAKTAHLVYLARVLHQKQQRSTNLFAQRSNTTLKRTREFLKRRHFPFWRRSGGRVNGRWDFMSCLFIFLLSSHLLFSDKYSELNPRLAVYIGTSICGHVSGISCDAGVVHLGPSQQTCRVRVNSNKSRFPLAFSIMEVESPGRRRPLRKFNSDAPRWRRRHRFTTFLILGCSGKRETQKLLPTALEYSNNAINSLTGYGVEFFFFYFTRGLCASIIQTECGGGVATAAADGPSTPEFDTCTNCARREIMWMGEKKRGWKGESKAFGQSALACLRRVDFRLGTWDLSS